MPKPWADQPYPLIPSPTDTSGISPLTVSIASSMTFAHNAFVRTLNSILLQYEHLTSPTDIADLLIFSQCWHEMVHHHHHFEEKYLFPSIEVYSGEKGIMDGNVAQHHAFEAGLKEFGEYVYGVKAEEWDKEKFRGIVDSFAPALMKHLTEEISTLLALDKYGGEKLKVAWDDMENVIKKAPLDPYRVIPMGLGGVDAAYQKDMKTPFPWFVPYLSHYWFSRRLRGAWRFSPCTVFGKPKELPFAKEE